jgi:hypothetical protein
MENTTTLDTSKFLKQEDIEAISKIGQIKRDITAYFDMDLFINKVREIIDNSKHFSFRSETARLYIEKDRPTFIIKYISDDIQTGLNNIDGVGEELESKQVDYLADAISADIISKLSKFITGCIKDSEKLDELFSGLPVDVKEFFISNIYTIRINVKENNIYILYFI